MTFDEMIYEALALVATTYPLMAKENVQNPLIVYIPVAEIDEQCLVSSAQGAPNAKYSVHVWADTFAELDPLIQNVKTQLKTHTGFYEVIGAVSKDFQEGEYRAIIEVSIW